MRADEQLKVPYPWFGGKSTVAAEVWRRFGDVPNYIEPFFGSGAVLLGRPEPFGGVETINDLDGMVCNFWRAVRKEPDVVAEYADHPVFENDLHERHARLVRQKDSLQAQLEGSEKFYDAKAAGEWCWGMCCWIGGGFCSGEGPWQAVDGKLVHLSDAGRGVNRKRVHLGNAGRGVNRQLVHLGRGQGVNRKLVHLSDAGQGDSILPRNDGVYDWMRRLARRLQRVRVCCGDWRRVCGGKSGDALQCFFSGGNRCAVFLDPPYSAEAERNEQLYSHDDLAVAHDVRDWAVAHGDDERLRIALCGYESEHDMPDTWDKFTWKASGGYSKLADGETQAKANCHREVVYFSPHCEAERSDYPLFDANDWSEP